MSDKTKKKVQNYITVLNCDCGARMRYTGSSTSGAQPTYLHRCTDKSCGKQEYLENVYPLITHEEVD